MTRRFAGAAAALTLLGAGAAGLTAATGGSSAGGGGAVAASRLDDGKVLVSKAGISEEQAIAAAQTKAAGALNEVDLEYFNGRLVFNVDVGASDVKVDAASGAVAGVDTDDAGR